MPLEETDAAYVADMLDAARGILEFTKGLAYHAFVEDQMRRMAVERGFEIIGEAARQVSADFRAGYPDLPFSKMIGLRNVIAHGYADVDYRVLFKVATDDVPMLVQNLERLLSGGELP